MKFLKKYLQLWLVLAAFGIMVLIQPVIAGKAVNISIDSLKEMLLVIPPIFVLLGLLDVWVPKETMIRYMGHEAGII